MKYNQQTNKVTVLPSDVTYPNGIAISANSNHLIIITLCKLMRYWIRGPKAGTSEFFANLPRYPNNVRPDGKGGIGWRSIGRSTSSLPFGKNSHLIAIRIVAKGEKRQEMRGPKDVRPTEAVERVEWMAQYILDP
jgi:sugar lactone lactonase YvrE